MSSSSLARFTPGRRPAALARRSMECYPSDPNATASSLLAGKTLVLPVVSHGNVGQLASDLAIEALRLPRVAILDHAALLPCVGAGAFTADAEPPATHLALGFELRACASRAPGFALAQQRALVAPGAGRAFANDLAAFVARCAPRECVLLASVPSTRANVDPERPGPGAPIGAVAFRSVCVAPRSVAFRFASTSYKAPATEVPSFISKVSCSSRTAWSNTANVRCVRGRRLRAARFRFASPPGAFLC